MAKIHAMMDIGKRSMMNSQTALQTVAHNIANKTTEGYSRQRVEQVTNPPIVEGRAVMGMGARSASVHRVDNPFVTKQLNKETHNLGFLDSQAESLAQVEEVFNEQENKSLNQYLTDFFNSWRELSNNPESLAIRTLVRESGQNLTNDFSRIDRQLTDIQKDIDAQLVGHVEEINKISKEIGTLNEKIATIELQGLEANDLRDRRELLVKQLNEKVDIRVAEGESGMLQVSTSGNALLVTGIESSDLVVQESPDTNRLGIYVKTKEGYPTLELTQKIRGGQMGGLLEVRDRVIETSKEKVDELAYSISSEVNKIHTLGFDRLGRHGGVFFTSLDGVHGSAQKMKLSEDILTDVGRISAAGRSGGVGDNTVANVISSLQYREIMDDGRATMDDFYTSEVGRVGVLANRAIKTRETQSNIVQQITNLRDSISGVSLDEEATKMIEYQKAFDASARLIRTADEMFDTILNLKRL